MIHENTMSRQWGGGFLHRLTSYGLQFPKRAVIGIILLVALFAFEMFNFDTTRYALLNLLGPVSFAGLRWAAILAVAFCAIDFAGLVRLFTPEGNGEQPREVWYLMGAWLLGATMNALMTWWAVSLTLLDHDFGNEVLSRGQLLQIVPIFVAVLVWLTRILFIGALTVAGGHLVAFGRGGGGAKRERLPQGKPLTESSSIRRIDPVAARPTLVSEDIPQTSDDLPPFLSRRPHTVSQASPQRVPRNGESAATAANQPTTLRAEDAGEKRAQSPGRAPSPPEPSKSKRVQQRPPLGGYRGRNVEARSRRRS